jgi:hypothetical protein
VPAPRAARFSAGSAIQAYPVPVVDPLNPVDRRVTFEEESDMSYNVFAVTPANNSDHKNDATGAFIPGAKRFAAAYGGAYKTFDNSVGNRTKKNFLKTIQDGPSSLDMFAYFGHGYHHPPQLGSAHIYTRADIEEMADALREKLVPGGIVVLYACLAGSPTGLSTILQDKIGRDCWIYGHTSVGHSFANPDVSEVQQSRSPTYRDLFRGELRAAWSEALHYTDMWLRFPVMWDEYITRELYAIRLLGTWAVPGGDQYVFEWAKANGAYASLDDLNQDPVGTVREGKTGRRRGTWSIGHAIKIAWDDGGSETWSLPVVPMAQTILGVSGVAKRLKHTLPGKGQT